MTAREKLMMNSVHIPEYLKENARWVVWRYEQRKGKMSKVPYRIDGHRASSTEPSDFVSFDEAYRFFLENPKMNGLGVGVFGEFSFIDIDHCIDDYGNLADTAKKIVGLMGSYTEKSPSGTGIRIAFRTKQLIYDKERYYINNQKQGLEVYIAGATSKFLTITGDVLEDGEIGYRDEEVLSVAEIYMKRKQLQRKAISVPAKSNLTDESVLEKATSSAQGEKFTKLWQGDTSDYGGDASSADMALASMLAFWCGGELEQMDRLFRRSALMRNKWDSARGDSTYGQITLQKAVDGCGDFYKPVIVSTALEDFGELPQKLLELHPEKNARYGWTDIGNGRLFADIYRDGARYVPERSAWFVYDGIVWSKDVCNLKTMELCKQLADALLRHSLTLHDEHLRTSYIEKIRLWQKRNVRETILRDAQSVYPIAMSEFDADPYAINCLNGTYHLDTENFTEHSSEDLITKLAPVKYDPLARCPRFERFVGEITCFDSGKARFIQKAYGYGITGDTRYECLFILYGATSRNGKGTLCESTLGVMGTYACTSRPETICLKVGRDSGSPSEDIARLAGIRMVNISEPPKGMTLNAAQVKSMTGNDTLNARFLHENSFDFKPQFKLFINTNYLPVVNDMTLFSSGRVVIIPFDRHFEEHEQDRTLKTEFAKPENQSAILNWLIEGYRMLKREGLTQPPSVIDATASYRHESDKFAQFVEDHLEADVDGELRTSQVYSVYSDWCRDNGYHAENIRNFNQLLRACGEIVRRRPRDGGAMTTLLTGYRIVNAMFA